MTRNKLVAIMTLVVLSLVSCGVSSDQGATSSNLSEEFSSAMSSEIGSSVISSETESSGAISSTVESEPVSSIIANKTDANEPIFMLDANGGTCLSESVEIISSGRYFYLPIPTRTGCKFVDWYDSKEGGSPIDRYDLLRYVGPTPTTIYARWTRSLESSVKVKDTSLLGSETEKKIAKKAISIIENNITPYMSDVEKAKAIHDYLVLNTAYDYDNYVKNCLPDASYNIEGILLYNTGVCSGYARAFQLFMDVLDVECIYVTGTDIQTGIGHAWNEIKIDGVWSHVDVTWDDPVPDTAGYVRHKYFMVDDATMHKDHKW